MPAQYLTHRAQQRPRQPRYLERGTRGGSLFPRWNLIVPHQLLAWEGQDAQP